MNNKIILIALLLSVKINLFSQTFRVSIYSVPHSYKYRRDLSYKNVRSESSLKMKYYDAPLRIDLDSLFKVLEGVKNDTSLNADGDYRILLVFRNTVFFWKKRKYWISTNKKFISGNKRVFRNEELYEKIILLIPESHLRRFVED